MLNLAFILASPSGVPLMSLTLPSLLTFKSGGGKNAELKSPSPAFIKALARSMDSLWLIFLGSNDAASSRINGFSGCILPVTGVLDGKLLPLFCVGVIGNALVELPISI